MKRLRRFFKEVTLQQLAIRGLKLGRLTGKEKVLDLIKSLRPHKTEFELIRFGSATDGGYLVPDDIIGIEACFSPGVSTKSDFELDCLRKGMKIFMADKSVDKPSWEIPAEQYSFLKKFIGCVDNEDYITMESWVRSSDVSPDSDLLLQMDIEGSEYAAFLSMPNELISRFRIMVIEFHHFDFVWQPYIFDLVEAMVAKILRNHICVHIHPNNASGVNTTLGVKIPRALEFTFLRKDRTEIHGFQSELPHRLDADNTNEKPITLPSVWFKG